MKISNLSFAGSRKDVDEFYTRATFLCMTSLYEGWPMVLPEAMAYGCIPVVLDTFEAIFDIIEDGESGLIINQYIPDEMSRRLSELCNDTILLRKMADYAYKSIDRFSSAQIASRWEVILEEEIARRKRDLTRFWQPLI